MGEGAPTYKIGGAASKNAFWGPGAPRDHLRSRWQPLPPPTLILKPATLVRSIRAIYYGPIAGGCSVSGSNMRPVHLLVLSLACAASGACVDAV